MKTHQLKSLTYFFFFVLSCAIYYTVDFESHENTALTANTISIEQANAEMEIAKN